MNYVRNYKLFEKFWKPKPGSCGNRSIPIIKIPDQILRTKCHDISLGKDGKVPEDIKMLARDMFETMWGIGVGLAAPQVGRDINLFITKHGHEVFINPKIISSSPQTKKSVEGCLSIPNISGAVFRSEWIQVEYINLSGEKVQKYFSGFPAIVIQHEYDHLQGILFIDKLIN